ncbi:Ankrd28 [Symbiodinium sp. CCMP2456]|nr:Ankrd28 [Symbiodinium sp. CCMP2456]
MPHLRAHADVPPAASSPLYAAVRSGHEEAVGRLLSGNANPNHSVSIRGPSPMRAAVLNGHTEVMGRLISGGATVNPDDVWAALLLGNLRGARRLAKATGYSWALLRRGCWLLAGLLGTCAATYALSGALLQRAVAELLLLEGLPQQIAE